MLKRLKSVNLKIIQMYHFRLKWKRYTVCTDWWDSNFFEWDSHFFQWDSSFLPDGSPELLFQNPSESSVLCLLSAHQGLTVGFFAIVFSCMYG